MDRGEGDMYSYGDRHTQSEGVESSRTICHLEGSEKVFLVESERVSWR